MTKNERIELLVATAKRTLVAFFFGFVISAFFAVAIGARFEPIAKLERESIDLGVRLANAVFGESADRVSLPERSSPIVMVDIDARACAELADANRCTYDRIVQPEIVAAALEVIEAVDPAVAVLDMLVTPDAGPALLAESEKPGPPLLTAMELADIDRSSGTPGKGYLLSKSLCGASTCNRLEYLPAAAQILDGKARNYRRDIDVALLEDLGGTRREARPFPTIAQRAADIASSEELHDDGTPDPAIGYTIPSFSRGGVENERAQERRGRLRQIYDDNVEYYLLSDIKPDRGTPIELVGLPTDPILIIGSSAASGGDLHNTPLGPMGGMEVVANAIRSFQLAQPQQIPSVGEAFAIKISAVLKALIIIAMVEVFLAYFTMRRAQAAHRGVQVVGDGAFWDRWSIPILLTMLLAFVGEFSLTMWEVITQLHEDAGRAGAVDVIWPILGVTISALVGFSGEVIGKIDWLVDRVFQLITHLRNFRS